MLYYLKKLFWLNLASLKLLIYFNSLKLGISCGQAIIPTVTPLQTIPKKNHAESKYGTQSSSFS